MDDLTPEQLLKYARHLLETKNVEIDNMAFGQRKDKKVMTLSLDGDDMDSALAKVISVILESPVIERVGFLLNIWKVDPKDLTDRERAAPDTIDFEKHKARFLACIASVIDREGVRMDAIRYEVDLGKQAGAEGYVFNVGPLDLGTARSEDWFERVHRAFLSKARVAIGARRAVPAGIRPRPMGFLARDPSDIFGGNP